MNIGKPAADVLEDVFETYFKLRKEPLPDGVRFVCVCSGTLTKPLYDISERWLKIAEPSYSYTHYYAEAAVDVLSAIVLAYIIKIAETRHGPIRTYISGLILYVFVNSVVDLSS